MTSLATRAMVAFAALGLLAACSESEEEAPEPAAAATAPAEAAETEEAEAEEPAEAAEAAEEQPAADPAAAAAIVEQVGAPIYEGATLKSVGDDEGRPEAIYLTQDGFREVKAFYIEQLPEPAWTNNGFGMGPFGGSAWQWDSAEGDLRVVVSDEDDGTEVKLSHPGS